MEKLSYEIHEYWSGRAKGYSDYNKEEFRDSRYHSWKETLDQSIRSAFPGKEPGEIRVLDAGSGPGFFTGILCECGYRVTALDCTEAMLEEAAANVGAHADSVRWILGDVEAINFEDMSFDVIVSRNVTWNLPHPKRAYREWFRLLDQGGLLLNFDANWYRYLVDEQSKEAYERDRINTEEAGSYDCNVGDNFEKMEELARQMPMTELLRPDWDERVLTEIGFGTVESDREIWKRVWSEEEKTSCASTPMFMIKARKSDIKERVVRYWGKRSEAFLDQRRQELQDPITKRWLQEILSYLPEKRPLNILDVGCGCGYFSILLSKEGHICTGIDLTPEMVAGAERLAKEEKENCVFHVMDAENLSFGDKLFDVVISRNLTWTLPHPAKAYQEWLRVLKPGGLLLNFDANYGLEKTERMDQLPHDHSHQMLGHAMLEENDLIKQQLSISFHSRPAWDMETLGKLGAERITVDLKVGKRVFLKKDIFYNPTPIFTLAAVKEQ
ncbi:MAG: methyltransferase domain-containing protein [Lachnospiraceae bacterium]|nr:methyltransferase domain-containing protein [Lachnospiraceae bacterium]